MMFINSKSKPRTRTDPFVNLTVRSRLGFYQGIQTNVDYYRVFVLYIDSCKNTQSFCQQFVSETREKEINSQADIQRLRSVGIVSTNTFSPLESINFLRGENNCKLPFDLLH